MTKNKILQNSGWIILSVLSFAPVLLWLLEPSLIQKFSSLSQTTTSLGDIAGLCGMAMFSLVMILSARAKFFEKFFNGVNESYTAHHFFGGLAFVFLLFHPILLAYQYALTSFNSAALFLLPSNYWAQNFGTLGLFVMILALLVTFYSKLKYQVWKFTHKFIGLAFIFAFLHTFLIGADVASNIWLKIYLFILGALAIITYFYRTLFADYLVRVFNYKVKGVKQYDDKIWEISFAPQNRAIEFAPGQFGFIKLLSNEVTKEIHPFSFSSANGNPLKIAIKELGDYTNKIGKLKEGDTALVEGPFGAFNFRSFKNKKQVWIAGGIGITPFLSMLRSVTKEDSGYEIDLYYSVKDENSLAFKDEMDEIFQKYKNVNITYWVTSKDKFLTAEAIAAKISDLKERDIMICGPSIMMNALKGQLMFMQITKDQIHSEEFNLY